MTRGFALGCQILPLQGKERHCRKGRSAGNLNNPSMHSAAAPRLNVLARAPILAGLAIAISLERQGRFG